MKRATHNLVSVLVLVLLVAVGSTPLEASENQSLFINLTSNELDRAAMAVHFAHRVLQKKKMPATVFLNVDGVRLVNKNIPQSTHVSGQTIHEMLQAFMKDGGQVIVCPMCMNNVGGMSEADLLPGVKLGGPDTTWKALFADDVTVLSY